MPPPPPRHLQIHAAHGYLVSGFLSPATNLRNDAYGGDAPRRRRLLLDIVAACRRSVAEARSEDGGAGPPTPFAVGVKVNSADFQASTGRGGGGGLDEALGTVSALLGVTDFVEVSGGTYERPDFMLGAPVEIEGGGSSRATRVDPITGNAVSVGPASAQKASTVSREAFFAAFLDALVTAGIVRPPSLRAMTVGSSSSTRDPGAAKKDHAALMITGGIRSMRGISAALSQGADLVGMGRPTTMQPRLPAALVSGIAEAAAPYSVVVPRAFSWLGLGDAAPALLANFWHQEQMHRVGAGLAPNPHISPWSVIILPSIVSYAFDPLWCCKCLWAPGQGRCPLHCSVAAGAAVFAVVTIVFVVVAALVSASEARSLA